MAKLYYLLIMLSIWGRSSYAQEPNKVSGVYLVNSVRRINDELFLLKFAAKEPTGNLDSLELISDHVHFALKEGKTLSIAGDLAKVRDDGVGELRQLMIMLPSREGKTPIWVLSKKFPSQGLKGSRYLDMHAPSAFFVIF